jgi:hypothetical protein
MLKLGETVRGLTRLSVRFRRLGHSSGSIRCSRGVWIAASMLVVLTVVMPGPARGDIRPPRPKSLARPTLAGRDLPSPLHVVVAGMALSAATASAGLLLFRGIGTGLPVLRLATFLAAIVVFSSASALAYWSYRAQRQYEQEKSRRDAEYEATIRNWRSPGPVRPRGPAAPPAKAPS